MAGDWRDIYSYLISDTPQNIGDASMSGGGEDPKGPGGPLQFGTGKWVGDQYQVPDKYKGIIDVQHTMGGGEDPKASSSINIDWTKLPNGGMTPFGRIDRTIPAGPPNTPIAPGQQGILKDPKLVYNDPNFGWITPESNRKISAVEKYSKYMPALIMALGTAGIGALAAIPLAATAAVGAAKYAGGKSGTGSDPSLAARNPLLSGIQPTSPSSSAPVQSAASSGMGGLSSALTPQQATQLLRTVRGG